MSAQETIRDLDAISMALGARLTMLHATTTKGHDYLLRDAVMREVSEWRRMWDKNSAARAQRVALSDEQIEQAATDIAGSMQNSSGRTYWEFGSITLRQFACAIMATQSTDAENVSKNAGEMDTSPLTQPLIAEATRDDVAGDVNQVINAFNALKDRLQGIMRYDELTGTYSIPAAEFLDAINVIQDAAIAASTKDSV